MVQLQQYLSEATTMQEQQCIKNTVTHRGQTGLKSKKATNMCPRTLEINNKLINVYAPQTFLKSINSRCRNYTVSQKRAIVSIAICCTVFKLFDVEYS